MLIEPRTYESGGM